LPLVGLDNSLEDSIDYILKKPVQSLDDLLEFLKTKMHMNHYHFDLISQAYNYARWAHEGKTRNTGGDYTKNHLLPVAQVAAYIFMQKKCHNPNQDQYQEKVSEVVAAALTHDTVEDGYNEGATIETLISYFSNSERGREIAALVEASTKYSFGRSNGNRRKKSIWEFATGVFLNPDVLPILIADRTHNLLTSSGLVPERQMGIAISTGLYYYPIAVISGYGEYAKLLMQLSQKSYTEAQQRLPNFNLLNLITTPNFGVFQL
jgi:(p)ppGpp synthase/HD superfamily hydrolase